MVQRFARRTVSDHGKANTELEAIASRKNLTLPQELSAGLHATMQRLQALTSPEFDAASMAAMDQDHGKAVALFQSASGPGFLDADQPGRALRRWPAENRARGEGGHPTAGPALPHLGRITASMTWIVPLVAAMSVVTTFAPSTFTPPFATEIFTD